ncbi:alpha-tocopherol transfer protein-like [Melitaea cinxia]|uniref:alpha-tocopherol transfer protein-like n=1 Tax=Melitaea cinxia TaxID=113334 RepID=UPI001E2717B3|nr:alpha-tocopherol transfer protein-like [Melitaea cinxia]
MSLHFEPDGTPFVMCEKHKIKLEKEPITENFYVKKARDELRETPENIENGLKELRQLLKCETNLVIPLDEDEFLLKFLRPAKFYAKSAFERIQAYYKFRLSHQDYCQDLFPSNVRVAFDHSIISILSPRDENGRRIMFVESGEKWNPRDVPLRDVFRGVQLGLESAMVEPRTQVCGVVVILDMKGLSFTHIMQFTPSFAKMVVDWIQDCIPIRLKGVHIVNQPYIFNMLFAIFKPFLRQKLRSRIFFHGTDKKSLLKHINKEALMMRLGGCLPDNEISGEVLWKMLHHYEESFRRADSYGYITNNNK